MKVRERRDVIDYLLKRKLGKQYYKAKTYLENDQTRMVDFRLRKPKSEKFIILE